MPKFEIKRLSRVQSRYIIETLDSGGPESLWLLLILLVIEFPETLEILVNVKKNFNCFIRRLMINFV